VALARVGVGSNAVAAQATIERALAALARLGTVRARSSLYRTKPWGVTAQPDFINAAALLETSLEPRALLREFKKLERALGRVPGRRWGPRAIDLDILAYDDLVLRAGDLVIPHERLFERAFALAPLAEIDRSYAAAFEALPAAARAEVERIASRPTRTLPPVDWEQTLERIRAAAAFCASSGLRRFRIDEPELSIEVLRSGAAPVAAAPAAEPAHAAAVASNGAPKAAAAAEAVVLRAEFVGIVRFARPTVAEGMVLGEARELAYVEALGIRNPVRASGPGRVAQVFVTDGQPVEYGEPLFAIETER
jgi:2-amino-4-hydroxy-6-hydroxymethyldihydropteridine diphosphokinase